MPQRVVRHSLLAGFQREAAKAVAALRQAITLRERELVALKTEAAQWHRVLHEPARKGDPVVLPPRVAPSKRRRLDWGTVLQELPPRFTTKEVAHQASKPLAQVYTHVSGWMKAKKVRKVAGGYQKVARAT
jgi:hypothetical protein